MIQETFPMTVAEEEVLNERELLVRVESGLMMDSTDSVRYIILHCSATRCNGDYTVEQLLRDHRARGFRTIGYHFYVRRDGTVSQHRRLLEVGAHCRPFNRCSIGVCYEGGLECISVPVRSYIPAFSRDAAFFCIYVPYAPVSDGRFNWKATCSCFNIQ